MSKRVRGESISLEAEVEHGCRTDSDDASSHAPKCASLEPPERTVAVMRCGLPPHKPLTFTSYESYEIHYQQIHTNRCSECRKNLPTAHFLNLHIAEHHDPIVAGKWEKGEKTFACFVEGCEKVCSDWKKRRSHLVDKHLFPKNYDFFIVDNGIDGRRSMLRPGVDAQGHRKSSRESSNSSATEITQTTEATSLSEQNEGDAEEEVANGGASAVNEPKRVEQKNADMEELTSHLSSLKMVPRQITFGKRKGRSGFAKS